MKQCFLLFQCLLKLNRVVFHQLNIFHIIFILYVEKHRCAGSLPPRLVLRAGSPVSSAECRVSAAVPLPSCARWGPPPPLPWASPSVTPGVSSSSEWVATFQQTPKVQLLSLSPEGDVPATTHPSIFPHVLGQEGKAPCQRGVL